MFTVHFGPTAYEIREHESILELACRTGFPLAAGCHRGGCGVCRIRLSAGEVSLRGPLSRTRVSVAEEADGFTLACQAVPATDIEVAQYTRFQRKGQWMTCTELVSCI